MVSKFYKCVWESIKVLHMFYEQQIEYSYDTFVFSVFIISEVASWLVMYPDSFH